VKKAKEKKSTVQRRFWPYGIALFVALLALDQYTKHFILAHYALNESRNILPGLWFTYVQNTGTNWGFFNGASLNWVFLYLSIIAFGILVYFFDHFKTTIEKISYALIMAGLWGNLLDRGALGFVVDFIDFRWWPVFNIADSCIIVGILLLIVSQWSKK
jgi:signal peptidase II